MVKLTQITVNNKRKGPSLGNHDQKSKKRKSMDNSSFFVKLVHDEGLVLKDGSSNNEISVDLISFQKNLSASLKAHSDYPQVVEDFIEGVQNYIEEPCKFHKMLMPTVTSSECDNAQASIQDSAIRILMGIDVLQTSLMNIIVEKLPEFTDEDAHLHKESRNLLTPKLLLSQFLWLDRIIDCKSLTTKMLEMISITCFNVQREIITCLPEIIEDSDHARVAKSLRERIVEDNKLMVPVLDALSNLNLSKDLVIEIRESVVRKLDSIELENLPVVIKFLLQTVSAQDTIEVISEIRSKLIFKNGLSRNKKASSNTSVNKSGKQYMSAILDAIKIGINFQRSVAESFIKAIEDVKNPVDQKAFDICVLFVIFSTNRKKAVEGLFKKKIRNGCFTEALFESTFASHSQVLQEYFPSILALSEVLLKSSEETISYVAGCMYKQCFIVFDPFCRQEVVGNLVMHIGSGSDREIDASLSILSNLIHSHLAKMMSFSVLVKGVLDYIDNLSITQIRKLYFMLSCLAFNSSEEMVSIQDDLHIVIRKQLSSSDLKYKCMGVIGAVMVVKSISSVSDEKEPLSEEVCGHFISLLQLVRNSSSASPEIFALFLDELSSVVGKGGVDAKIEAWISDNVTGDFQDDFVVDIEEDKLKKPSPVPLELCLGLNDIEESVIAIDLLPLVVKSKTKDTFINNTGDQKSPDPLCLAPNFRLVQICEHRQQEGNLEGIDALLGCPLYTVNRTVINKLSSLSQKSKEIICATLIHEVNWFIEVVNGFALQNDVEMRRKVIWRIQNIIDSCKLLDKVLAETPNFVIPGVPHLKDKVPTQMSSVPREGKKGAKKKKGEPENDSDEADDTCDETQKASKESPSTKSQVSVESSIDTKGLSPSARYKRYLRDFDLDVFSLLATQLVQGAVTDVDKNAEIVEFANLKLTPIQLNFILEDLVEKLANTIISSNSKTPLKKKYPRKNESGDLGQYSPRQIVKNIFSLIPSLCDHLNSASKYLQLKNNDEDALLLSESDKMQFYAMVSIFKHVVEVFFFFFTWNGFLMPENRELCNKAVDVLVTHVIRNSDFHSAPDLHIVRKAFQYFASFSEVIVDLENGLILIELLKALADMHQFTDLFSQIAQLSSDLLKKKWLKMNGEVEKGQKHNELLKSILGYYIKLSDDQLASIELLATKGFPELINTEKNGCSETYQSLNRNSFPVYFQVIYSKLVESSKLISSTRQAGVAETQEDQLIKWNIAVRIQHVLVDLLKVFDGRTILGSVLRFGRQFIEVFYRSAMPLLDSMFRYHKEDVLSLLKAFQLSTRTLHHLCSHSKIIKDVSLTSQVPNMKKALEALIYRVMLMLTVNKCHEAFWMGNLKNRDLHGEELLSQVSASSQALNKSAEQDEGSEAGSEDDSVENMDDEDVVECSPASCSETF